MTRIEELRESYEARRAGQLRSSSLRETRELLEEIDALTAELDTLKRRQTWDDRDMTGMSCELVSARNERDKLRTEIAAMTAERDGLRAACENIAGRRTAGMLPHQVAQSALAAAARGEEK